MNSQYILLYLTIDSVPVAVGIILVSTSWHEGFQVLSSPAGPCDVVVVSSVFPPKTVTMDADFLGLCMYDFATQLQGIFAFPPSTVVNDEFAKFLSI